jgi:hypothetical protein
MPKNADDKLYLNPAIPRDTRLAEYLEESSARSGITKSQLLVWFAAEYVRLVVDSPSVTPATPAPSAPLAKHSETKTERIETHGSNGGIRTLESIGVGGDPNFDSFGEPD